MRTGHACCPTPVRTEHPSGAHRGPRWPTGRASRAGHRRAVCRGAGRYHPAPGWQEWSRAGRDAECRSRWACPSANGPTGSTQCGHAPHAGDASAQRPGQCRSSTDSNVTVSRHTRYGGRAVRAVIDIPIVHHKAAQLSNAPGVSRPSSRRFRTKRAGAAGHIDTSTRFTMPSLSPWSGLHSRAVDWSHPLNGRTTRKAATR